MEHKNEEIDLYLATADYKEDLSSYFKNKKNISNILRHLNKISDLIDENNSIIEELSDPEFLEIFKINLTDLLFEQEKLFKRILNQNKLAKSHCYLHFKASTGGKESEDLCFVLFSNYLKMLDTAGIDHEVVEIEYTHSCIIKNAIIKVNMEYAYGFFKEEKGVHRFTRVSPYGNGKLHTSFVFVDVYPYIKFDKQIDINKNDVRVDTFRGSGAGGQHRNKTDSAVRLTHLPSGVVVKVENERSQHQNKSIAYDMLASKLFEIKESQYGENTKETKGKSDVIDWGRQIRSYVIGQNRIKNQNNSVCFDGTLSNYFKTLDCFIFKTNYTINFPKVK